MNILRSFFSSSADNSTDQDVYGGYSKQQLGSLTTEGDGEYTVRWKWNQNTSKLDLWLTDWIIKRFHVWVASLSLPIFKKRREKQKWICNLYSVKFMRSTLIYPRLWIHMEAKFYIHSFHSRICGALNSQLSMCSFEWKMWIWYEGRLTIKKLGDVPIFGACSIFSPLAQTLEGCHVCGERACVQLRPNTRGKDNEK